MAFAMPALAQTTTTTCRNTFGGVTCDSTTTQPWKMPEIQQVDVAGAIRAAEESKIRRQQSELLERQNRALEESGKQSNAQVTSFGEDPNLEFIRFRENNPWYDLGGLAGATQDEKRARALADLTADKFSAQGLQKQISPSEFFARVASEVKRQIPELAD